MMRSSIPAEVEDVSKKWTQCRYTCNNDAHTVFCVAPEYDVRYTDCDGVLALESLGGGTVNIQRYSSVLVRLTVYARRMHADRLALRQY